jgi:toxin CptA
VLAGSFVSAYLTVLNVKTEASRWRTSLILTPDRVDVGAFRRLRVWLRWGRHDRKPLLLREEEPA